MKFWTRSKTLLLHPPFRPLLLKMGGCYPLFDIKSVLLLADKVFCFGVGVVVGVGSELFRPNILLSVVTRVGRPLA